MATEKKKVEKTKKKKLSLKERVAAKREELKQKGKRSNIFRQKEEGTIRIRILKVDNEGEFWVELVQFWLNKELGSINSPATFGDECPAMQKYQELKESDDDTDVDFAKKLAPRSKPVIPVIVYKDLKGKKIDETQSGKLFQITGGLLQEIMDLYLDEDEWGDMTDPQKGYDLKITREGMGKTDTNYTVQPCKNTPVPKEYRKPVNLEQMVREEIDEHDDIAKRIDKWLDSDSDDDDDDKPKPKKKKSFSKEKTKAPIKKKKRNRDI